MTITLRLITKIQNEYPLDIGGVHGMNHWARVHEIGLKLSELTGADPVVLELFAVFHDSRRLNEGRDPNHGQRGAALARSLWGEYFEATEDQLKLLCRACEGHTHGKPSAQEDTTVLACWDSDRLDLSRVGITPDPKFLCTQGARTAEMISWASSLYLGNFEKYPFYV